MYDDDVVLVSRMEVETNKMIKVLENLCELSYFKVNTNKTKVMLIKTKGMGAMSQPQITHKGQLIETVDYFQYLELEIPLDHKWYRCTK